MERVTIHPLAAQHIAELRAKFGVDVSLDDAVWLHALACKVSRPMGLPHEGAAGAPVRLAGGVVLWPLTIGAATWLGDVLAAFPAGVDATMAMAYAMVHARQPDALPDGLPYSELAALLRRFRRGLGVRGAELAEAISIILAREPSAPGGDTDTDPLRVYRDMIAMLCGAYPGTSPEYWRWGVARCEALDMLAARTAQLAAKGKTMLGSDPSGMAFKAFVEARKTIVAEHRAKS